MNILFTICGRAGSKGFKNKNLKELRGVPLSYFSLAVIKCYIDRHPEDKVLVALNTDSEPLVELIYKQEFVPVIYIKRKDELAGDVVAKVDVIKDTMLSCKDFNPDIVVDLDITSPMRRVIDIENIITEFKREYTILFLVLLKLEEVLILIWLRLNQMAFIGKYVNLHLLHVSKLLNHMK